MLDIIFANPHFLWLLIPLIGGLVWRWFSVPASIAVSSTDHYTKTAPRKHFAPRHLLLLLEIFAAAAFIFALARPQSDMEIVPVTKEGTDIMLVLDYSNSMDAFDPASDMDDSAVRKGIAQGRIKDRLGVAKDQINRFVSRRSGDRIGLVIFGHLGNLAVDPTIDHDHLIGYVNQLENSLLSQSERGTNIAGGISQGIIALKDYNETRRTIVLITDGDHTVPDPVYTPVTAAEAAKKQDITIHTVGIGSDDPFLLGPLSRMGATIRFDTRNLEKIASITGGQFFRAKDNKGFEDVMDTIDALEKTSKQRPALIYQRDLYPTLLLGGIAALGLAIFLRYTVLREIS